MIRVSLAAVACLGLVPAALAAQEPADTTKLAEIVVTATQYPTTPDSVAATVSVIRGDDLRARGIHFVADALREIPGAQVVQNGPYGATTSLFVRGGESDYVKVLVDGVAVNQPGGFFDFGSLTTDNVERIEVLRGPGSVLYGSDAIAGVIQIVTRQGRGRTTAGATGEAGSFSTARLEGTAQGGGEWGGWSASASRLTSDGTYAFNNDYGNTSLTGRLRCPPRRPYRGGRVRALVRRGVPLSHRLHRDAGRPRPAHRRPHPRTGGGRLEATLFRGGGPAAARPQRHDRPLRERAGSAAGTLGRVQQPHRCRPHLGRGTVAAPAPGDGAGRGRGRVRAAASERRHDRPGPGQLGLLRPGQRLPSRATAAHGRRPAGSERAVRKLLDVPGERPRLRRRPHPHPRVGRHRVQGAELLRELRQPVQRGKSRSQAGAELQRRRRGGSGSDG